MSMDIKRAKMSVGGYGPRAGYMGDPGLFGFLGGVAKTIGGIALGAAKSLPGVGTVVGAAESAIGRAFRGRGRGVQVMPPSTIRTPFQFSPSSQMQLRRIAPPVTNGTYGQRLPVGYGTIPSAAAPGLQTPPPGPTGWRANKTGYYVQAVPGQPEQGGVWVPPQSAWVRSRRRNPLNPRALDRSISRIKSAKRAAKKLSSITVREVC